MDNPKQINNPLFPTTTSFLIFLSYISLFVSQGLLVKKSHIEGFDAVLVVILTELVKLLICIASYLVRSNGNYSDLIVDLKRNNRLLILYLVPSFLYCLYNNLIFINLKLFDVTTYYCLMQFRIVLTAVIYQILFRRKLTSTQWVSLIILTIGCFLKEYGLYDSITNKQGISNNLNSTTSIRNQTESMAVERDKHGMSSLFNMIWLTSMLLLQMFCSCFAGVYNEYLLKDSATAKSADVILQNIYMYVDSIFCNIIVFQLATNSSVKYGSVDEISIVAKIYNLLTNPLIVILILNNAFSGLVASFFLKNLNSILKTFASALELFAVALLAWIIFEDRIDMYTITALFLVAVAMIVYSRNPVSVAPPSRITESKDGFMLLPTTEV